MPQDIDNNIKNNNIEIIIPEEMDKFRIDMAISQLLPEYSRAQIQKWIKNDNIKINNKSCKAKDKISSQDKINIIIENREPIEDAPENIPLDILFEDEHILVINKPAGLIVHPGAGNAGGTLLNALLHYIPKQKNLARAGIVHRLDKDTSGVMVVAKSEPAQKDLISQLQDRTMYREYEAIIEGVLTGGFDVNMPIGRHPKNRIKMAVRDDGKEAITEVRVIKKYESHTHIQAKILTGRTHQIRVHLSHKNYPIVGDIIYGARKVVPKNSSETQIDIIRRFPRQALHAKTLKLVHPNTNNNQTLSFTAPVPEDMNNLIKNI